MDRARTKIRYRFGDFVVSPTRRVVLRGGREVPLIPRYFDLLLLLLERRDEAIARRAILEAVWSDVVVSDGALSQAVRTLRRALGDDSRDRYIRTIPRHGYRFVFAAVVEEEDDPSSLEDSGTSSGDDPAGADAIDGLVHTVLGADGGAEADDARREAAEALHSLDTAEALRRIDRLPGHEQARALLRDARWEAPRSGPVPIWGQPGMWKATRLLIGLRVRRVRRLAGHRWLSAVIAAGLAGMAAGVAGALLLRFGPGARATSTVFVVLPLVGAVVGGLGAAGVAAGLAWAEVTLRSARRPALVLFGGLGGGMVGGAAHSVGLLLLQGLFGKDLTPLGGGLEGFVLGGAVGLGYAVATPTREGGMAAPRGVGRLRAALAAGIACSAAAVGLALAGRHLGAMSLDLMARSFPESQVGLDPLARLLGEPLPGPRTAAVVSAWEGLVFGFGTVFGMTRRPR